MGEVQYIVTLPQSSQASAIQLPSTKFFIFILVLMFFIIRRTSYSIISNNTIANDDDWCKYILLFNN